VPPRGLLLLMPASRAAATPLPGGGWAAPWGLSKAAWGAWGLLG
jgi:hypothetical protein